MNNFQIGHHTHELMLAEEELKHIGEDFKNACIGDQICWDNTKDKLGYKKEVLDKVSYHKKELKKAQSDRDGDDYQHPMMMGLENEIE